jgi:hypothetical protein
MILIGRNGRRTGGGDKDEQAKSGDCFQGFSSL